MSTTTTPRLSIKPTPPTLRGRLLRHVVAPLIVVWAMGAALTAMVAQHFVVSAYDRSLLDDALSLSSNVRLEEGRLQLNLSAAEMRALLFDQSESNSFAVFDGDGRLVAGQAGLRNLAASPASAPRFFSDGNLRGVPVRSASVWRDSPVGYSVTVAQTTRSRSTLARNVLLLSLVPQTLLLLGLVWWTQRVIRSDVAPISELQNELAQRDVRDLSPLAVRASTGDLQRVNDEINGLLGRVSEGITAQREFAGNVAHELRTPLAGIRALASFGLARDDSAVWREQLQAIAQSEERASHLVDQLLALALADEMRYGLALQSVDLEAVARVAIMHYLPAADRQNVDLGADFVEGADYRVRAHPALVEGVLNNLIDNALRYGRDPSAAAMYVTVGLARSNDRVLLSVSDSGPGIPRIKFDDVTQRWAQDSAGKSLGAGVGLGLAIVTQYARLMNVPFTLREAAPPRPWALVLEFPEAERAEPTASQIPFPRQ